MKKAILYMTMILGMALTGYSQDTNKSLKLYAKYSDQGVQLKVAPQKASTWLKGAEQGYNYYRRETGAADFVKINNKAILPWNADDITREMGAGNDSLVDYQQQSIFNQIKDRKIARDPLESVRYAETLQNNYGFYFLITTRLPLISKISGLEFIDENAQAGLSYEYKVELIGGDPSTDNASCNIFTDTGSLFLPLPEAYEGEKVIKLEWEQAADGRYISYYVERSDDGDNYTRLNKSPLYLNLGKEKDSTGAYLNNRIYYVDSLDENYKAHFYHIIGVDVWGEESKPSMSMTYMGRDRTAPALPDSMWVAPDEKAKSLAFTWKYDRLPDDLSGLMVFHADSMEGPYLPMSEDLMAPGTTHIVKANVVAGNNQYFQLLVSDTAGNYQYGKPVYGYLPDVYPPLAPTGVKAVIDSMGIVQVSWDENNEDDLKGYEVYRSNGTKLRMIKITGYPIEENHFVDTLSLHRLNRKSHYSILALDKSFNYSDYSETVAVEIPDTLAPAPANLVSVTHDGSNVHLLWVVSISSDVQKQDVYLCNMDGDIISTLTSLSPSDSAFSYPLDKPGTYYFSLAAVDESGNRSELSNLQTLSIEVTEAEPKVESLRARKNKNTVELSWKQSGPAAYAFRIYRINENANIRQVAQTAELKYVDTPPLATGSYSYYIIPVSDKGELYEKSELATVKF